MNAKIREILGKYGRLPIDIATLGDDADLHAAGLTSFASVELMMALEEGFDVEFPDKMMNRRNFASVSAIESALKSLQTEAAAA